MPPTEILATPLYNTCFQYDPQHPCPSIGGNVFPYKDVLLSGPYNQVEREEMFLCHKPGEGHVKGMPLSSRRDVLVFRSEELKQPVDVTGQPVVVLYVSSDCVDTDFTAKLIDEYPPSFDYPSAFAMNITHGIIRCRYRDNREKPTLMEPGKCYEVKIELYPVSNLFAVGHRIRLDISSSNFPHFDINPNTGSEYGVNQKMKIAENTVYHHHFYPSRMILPILEHDFQVKKMKLRGLRRAILADEIE